MSELRLVPAAITSWLAVLILLVSGSPLLAGVVISAGIAVAWVLRQPGQAVLTGAVGAVSAVVASLRVARSERWAQEYSGVVVGKLLADPRETAGGSWYLRLQVEGYPAQLAVFVDKPPADLHSGAWVLVEGEAIASQRAGVGAIVMEGEIGAYREASGWAAMIKTRFAETVAETLAGEHAGLIPGMVLGDTSLQSAASEQLYVATGLSHLSAVSGSNVAIVTSTAVILCRALTLGPRVQTAAAAVTLAGFVAVVGTEPSVLRATVTGLVGLAAVINSSRMEPLHALSLSIIVLLLFDSNLAVEYGFALSVVATAGIVVLTGLIARPLARVGVPPILARAFGVAVAADVVTMPVIALMTGQIPTVGVIANVLAAPATAPVTILGLIAAGLSLLPGPLDQWAVLLISPLTWWIHQAAAWCAALPVSSIEIEPVAALLLAGWIVYLIHWKPRLALLLPVLLLLGPSRAPVVPLTELQVYSVESAEGVGSAPVGTQVILVERAEGRASPRPIVNEQGIPVLFPNRDGEVTLHRDGSQHAADGRF